MHHTGIASTVQTAAAVAAHASMLAGMLEPADAAAVQLTPFGRLAPPLGLARVKVAELFAALLGVGSASAGGAVAAAGVLQRTLALVLQFPFNNILHAQVPCSSPEQAADGNAADLAPCARSWQLL